jgi:DHHW protein
VRDKRKIDGSLIAEKRVKKFDKTYRIIISIMFVGFLTICILINYLKKDDIYSEVENRNLKTKPSFSLKEFFLGSYTSDFDSYISDQFFGRKEFISLKTKIQQLGGNNKINNVYIGKDGQLFEDFKIESDEKINDKIQVMNDFKEMNPNTNIEFMLIPTATSVLKDNLPKYAPIDNELDYINKVGEGLDNSIKFINPYKNLKENSNEYIYYKTDHHWTSDGAYIGYKSFCEANGIEAKEKSDFDELVVSEAFYGSLSSKVGVYGSNADKVKVYVPKEDNIVVNYVSEQKKVPSLFDSESLNKKDKYQVFTGGNHPLINIKTANNIDKKLLIVKDSYANSMIPFLTENYGEIDVIDLRYYTDSLQDFINTKNITDVLFMYNVNTFNGDDSIFNINE